MKCTTLDSLPTSRYLRRFLDLRSAGDILNAAAPINRADKEITEAWAAIRHLRPYFLDAPMERLLIDLCAGNALTSIIAAHILPVKSAFAIDKTPRRRPGHTAVQRWAYDQGNIFSVGWNPEIELMRDAAVCAVHACGQLAIRVIELYQQWPWAKRLVLLPCCRGNMKGHRVPAAFASRVSKYEAWAWWLSELANGELHIDENVLSPCNGVIVAEKGR